MKLVVAALSTSLLASATFAGGLEAPVTEAPVPAPMVYATGTDWSGFYAGLQYGTGDLSASAGGVSVDIADFDAYGAHAGYMWDLGTVVVGAELDYNNVSLDVDGAEDGDLLRLRGRVGADLGRFLPYASLGVARLSSDGESETGTVYGVGADFLVSDSFSVGAEYTKHDFDDLGGTGISAEADLIQVRASFRF